ncbi:hypothetical protein [Sediminibacillus albus]|uniref:Uncharacterized protein n=1 Tax=Sediminibacillus albus TaxID=407036 RepID=A0A1G8WYD2_9BACI|nr:hypothetical protein [Sediminibacillus albus]SDJ82550.1 hypothetical protein SAMN05216243_1030 [Sediminibacillus albus]
MKWEVPPHSSNGIKLIGTDKVNKEIFLHFIGSGVSRERVRLSHVQYESKEIQEYVSMYLAKILSGVYDMNLTNRM